ncbi:MAG: transcriptional regulator, partial [Mariprofundaceae bacterium]|nr:transcriptional regulator [Mariprofundaceae bacterium]
MDKVERVQRLHAILRKCRTPVSLGSICERLECSESTAKRLIRDMRLYLDAPIINQPGTGYSYARNSIFELPGVWFSPEELHALLTIQQLTANLSGGLFDDSIKLIRDKAASLLGSHVPSPEEIRRVRVLGAGARSKTLPMFSIVANAVMHRQRIHIRYHSRQHDEWTEREISPQRLVFYRGNWYLDSWCHKKGDLRSFAVEKIEHARFLDTGCKEIPDAELDEKLTTSFGIFSGKPKATAVLHFSEKAARWVQDEEWFPDVSGNWLDDGRYELRIPYNNPTELVMEICRYGADVEVIEPP